MRCVLWLAPALLLAARASAEAPAVSPSDLISLARSAQERVAKLRELSFRQKIRFEMTSKDKVRSYLLKSIEEQYKPGELEQEGLAWKALGLIPAELDYRGFMVALYEEQVGGYYDPKKKTFYLADWIADTLQEPIITHELAHALDDQHFDLSKFNDRIRGNSDTMYARSALAEGVATLIMMMDALQQAGGGNVDFSLLDMDGVLGSAMMSLQAQQFPQFAAAPEVLRQALMFPYIKGLSFVSFGKKRAGWKAIDRAYADLPRSTEQIIHPEKYFVERDVPIEVSLGFLDRAALPGWKTIFEDVLGEFMSQQLLSGLPDDEAKRAAAGWDGDRVRVYQKGDELAFVQRSEWDSEDDAVEWAGAFAKTIPQRGAGFEHQPPVRGETRMLFTDAARRAIIIERRERSVLIIHRLPADLAEEIRRAAW
jgi:hypothetical protein